MGTACDTEGHGLRNPGPRQGRVTMVLQSAVVTEPVLRPKAKGGRPAAPQSAVLCLLLRCCVPGAAADAHARSRAPSPGAPSHHLWESWGSGPCRPRVNKRHCSREAKGRGVCWASPHLCRPRESHAHWVSSKPPARLSLWSWAMSRAFSHGLTGAEPRKPGRRLIRAPACRCRREACARCVGCR